jgi:hypothetical protein
VNHERDHADEPCEHCHRAAHYSTTSVVQADGTLETPGLLPPAARVSVTRKPSVSHLPALGPTRASVWNWSPVTWAQLVVGGIGESDCHPALVS